MPRASSTNEFHVSVGNNLGAGADLFGRLKEAGVNILASCCYQIGDAAHLSFVPQETDQAEAVMREHHLAFEVHEVLLVEIPHQPGAFAEVLREVAALNVQTRSAYITPTPGTGLVVLKTDDNARVLSELNRAQPSSE